MLPARPSEILKSAIVINDLKSKHNCELKYSDVCELLIFVSLCVYHVSLRHLILSKTHLQSF